MRRLKRLFCALIGHANVTKKYDARGRRVEVTRCHRCGTIDYDSLSVTPRNRAMRRRWARGVARELSR